MDVTHFSKPAALAAATAAGTPACSACEAIASGISVYVQFGNVTSEACIRLGQEMCHTFDVLGKLQTGACDAIVNRTDAIKNAIIDGMLPDGACEAVGFC